MPRLRSIAVVALLWVAAFAASSAPDGFGGPRRTEMPLVAVTNARSAQSASTVGTVRKGKRWALLDTTGKRWTLLDTTGNRWALLDTTGNRWV